MKYIYSFCNKNSKHLHRYIVQKCTNKINGDKVVIDLFSL